MDRSVIVSVLLIVTLVALAIVSRLRRVGTPKPLAPAQDAAIAKANRLWKSDPQTAHRIIDSAFEEEGQHEDEERAALRVQAETDPAAAEELRRRLREDLEVWQTLLKRSRKHAAKGDVTAQGAVANQEKWENETRAELAQVEELIRQLKG